MEHVQHDRRPFARRAHHGGRGGGDPVRAAPEIPQMRPSVAEERAHAILDQLDDWTLASEERSAFGKRLATQWRRSSVFDAAALFGLSVFAMFALIALCKSIGATEFAAAPTGAAAGEGVIRTTRMLRRGPEAALFIGGLIAFIGGL